MSACRRLLVCGLAALLAACEVDLDICDAAPTPDKTVEPGTVDGACEHHGDCAEGICLCGTCVRLMQ